MLLTCLIDADSRRASPSRRPHGRRRVGLLLRGVTAMLVIVPDDHIPAGLDVAAGLSSHHPLRAGRD